MKSFEFMIYFGAREDLVKISAGISARLLLGKNKTISISVRIFFSYTSVHLVFDQFPFTYKLLINSNLT